MLSLSRVERSPWKRKTITCIRICVPVTERVRARETWHFFGSKNLCRGSRGGGNLKAPVGSFFSFSKRCSSQGLRMRTEDPCDRATVSETRKAAPRAPPIRSRVTASHPHHVRAAVRGDLATTPSPQTNHTKHLSLVLPVPATPWSADFRIVLVPLRPVLSYWSKFRVVFGYPVAWLFLDRSLPTTLTKPGSSNDCQPKRRSENTSKYTQLAISYLYDASTANNPCEINFKPLFKCFLVNWFIAFVRVSLFKNIFITAHYCTVIDASAYPVFKEVDISESKTQL